MTETGTYRRRYVTVICESLAKSYGPAIVEDDTDIRIADTIIKDLVGEFKYVNINALPHCLPMSNEDFKDWRYIFLKRLGYENKAKELI